MEPSKGHELKKLAECKYLARGGGVLLAIVERQFYVRWNASLRNSLAGF